MFRTFFLKFGRFPFSRRGFFVFAAIFAAVVLFSFFFAFRSNAAELGPSIQPPTPLNSGDPVTSPSPLDVDTLGGSPRPETPTTPVTPAPLPKTERTPRHVTRPVSGLPLTSPLPVPLATTMLAADLPPELPWEVV